MKILTWRSLPLVAVALALPLFSQSAKATEIQFACGIGAITPACNGSASTTIAGDGTTVASSSSAGITVENVQGPAGGGVEQDLGSNFTLSWSYSNPGGGSATLAETGNDHSTLTGNIVSGVYNSTAHQTTLGVQFNSLPADFQNFLGTPTGVGGIFYIDLTTTGGVLTAEVNIGPTPEPASYFLMGTGMLLCGLLLRRHLGATAATTTA